MAVLHRFDCNCLGIINIFMMVMYKFQRDILYKVEFVINDVNIDFKHSA